MLAAYTRQRDIYYCHSTLSYLGNFTLSHAIHFTGHRCLIFIIILRIDARVVPATQSAAGNFNDKSHEAKTAICRLIRLSSNITLTFAPTISPRITFHYLIFTAEFISPRTLHDVTPPLLTFIYIYHFKTWGSRLFDYFYILSSIILPSPYTGLYYRVLIDFIVSIAAADNTLIS